MSFFKHNKTIAMHGNISNQNCGGGGGGVAGWRGGCAGVVAPRLHEKFCPHSKEMVED